ncbi:MAG: class I SAM-dependent methyltransferase, partial [Alphaproteobacteria bacterium]
GLFMSLMKLTSLLSILFTNPGEFHDRLVIKFEGWLDGLWLGRPVYDENSFDDAAGALERNLGIPVAKILRERSLSDIESWVREGTLRIQGNPAFRLAHNADLDLARFCYVLCRAIRPRVVIETGVAYGVTSAFILKALEANRHGELHSIDLPPLAREGDRFVGALIPEELRHRWRLHRGTSKRILPRLLRQLGSIDLFVHDSLHTYRNMRFELETVTPFLTERSVVIADDIEGNTAFREWVDQAQPTFWVATREAEKNSVFGVSVHFHAHPPRS